MKSSIQNVYIPPGRRNIISQTNDTNQNTIEQKTNNNNTRRNISKPVKSQSYLLNIPINKENDDEYNEIIDEYKDADECSIVISGLSNDLTENQKSVLLKPYYDRGGISHWISNTEVLIVYPTQTITKSVLLIQKTTNINIKLLSDIISEEPVKYERYFKICKDLLQQAKPERNAKVATRLIGAALGIRVNNTKERNGEKNIKSNKLTKNNQEMGAWDD